MFDTLQATKDLKEAGIESNAAEAIVAAFGAIAENMVSKDDMQDLMQGFATKEDLKGFATKEDLKGFATKEDLKGLATKEDLKGLATSERVERGFAEIYKHIWFVGMGIVGINVLMIGVAFAIAKYAAA